MVGISPLCEAQELIFNKNVYGRSKRIEDSHDPNTYKIQLRERKPWRYIMKRTREHVLENESGLALEKLCRGAPLDMM